MTPVASDPLIKLFKEQRTFIEVHSDQFVYRKVTLIWQRFSRLGVSFLIHELEGHVDVGF